MFQSYDSGQQDEKVVFFYCVQFSLGFCWNFLAMLFNLEDWRRKET